MAIPSISGCGFSPPVSQQQDYSNACVTELNANHKPSEAESMQGKTLINNLCKPGGEDHTHAIQQLKDMKSALSALREQTFEVVNPSTRDVYGKLKEGCNENDRDQYIRALCLFYDIKKGVETELKKQGMMIKAVSDELNPHHCGALWGDILELNYSEQGFDIRIPNLTYNHGIDEVG